jgi:hypothetical protein
VRLPVRPCADTGLQHDRLLPKVVDLRQRGQESCSNSRDATCESAEALIAQARRPGQRRRSRRGRDRRARGLRRPAEAGDIAAARDRGPRPEALARPARSAAGGERARGPRAGRTPASSAALARACRWRSRLRSPTSSPPSSPRAPAQEGRGRGGHSALLLHAQLRARTTAIDQLSCVRPPSPRARALRNAAGFVLG